MQVNTSIGGIGLAEIISQNPFSIVAQDGDKPNGGNKESEIPENIKNAYGNIFSYAKNEKLGCNLDTGLSSCYSQAILLDIEMMNIDFIKDSISDDMATVFVNPESHPGKLEEYLSLLKDVKKYRDWRLSKSHLGFFYREDGQDYEYPLEKNPETKSLNGF